eukprot:Protomagalhaensia_sp_Gyna_25__5059@NODE_56_length_5952_cov_234_277524_g41_i0_p5_GENE_NODE_56_length_5952_cov_234_277524_g41_i0NODE_56_length_5952_cov_234_277524_g41_i0_p5_ORF_typecomplete_len116_score4_87_NODE_56_length_5952_cov_234_277524_g41_i042284575
MDTRLRMLTTTRAVDQCPYFQYIWRLSTLPWRGVSSGHSRSERTPYNRRLCVREVSKHLSLLPPALLESSIAPDSSHVKWKPYPPQYSQTDLCRILILELVTDVYMVTGFTYNLF